MRKVMPYLGASLSLLAAMWATSAKAQDQSSFKDLDSSHWAYQAVTDLQQKGILLGYPDGYFRGKRTLTRYEFAIALWRALQKVQAQVGPPGPAGEPGAPGPAGAPGMTPEEVAELKALTQEFKNDLAQLGANVKDIQSRLDAMAKDIADIKDYLNHIPKISGDIFVAFRSNRSRYNFLDQDGALIGASNTLTGGVEAVNDVHLNVATKLPGDVKAYVDAVFSNYLTSRENGYGTSLGGAPSVNATGNPEEVTVYQAAVEVPIKAINNNTSVTIGRFKNQITPLTYWRPNSDSYFDLPWYDDGKWIEDGLKFESKFGSATTTVFMGSYSSLTGTSGDGNLLNAPALGATMGPRENSVAKPSGINYQGQIVPSQSIGTHIGLPLFKFGELGFTIIDFGGGVIAGANDFNNVVVYGGNIALKHIGRLRVNAEFAKSVAQVGIGTDAPLGLSNDDDNAIIASVGYGTQGIGAEIGFQQIDPRFYAPGSWNKIGNWINPTNISGFYGSASYSPIKRLELMIRGDWYEGARNRVSEDSSEEGNTGFTRGSNILRGLTGAKYKLNKWFDLSADYEYVAYDLSQAVNPEGNGRANYLEQYLTLGVGVNLTPNAHFKLGYQMINNQNVDGSFGGVGDTGQLTGNSSVLTSQISVHF